MAPLFTITPRVTHGTHLLGIYLVKLRFNCSIIWLREGFVMGGLTCLFVHGITSGRRSVEGCEGMREPEDDPYQDMVCVITS